MFIFLLGLFIFIFYLYIYIYFISIICLEIFLKSKLVFIINLVWKCYLEDASHNNYLRNNLLYLQNNLSSVITILTIQISLRSNVGYCIVFPTLISKSFLISYNYSSLVFCLVCHHMLALKYISDLQAKQGRYGQLQ